jgi:hypothetical protein
MSREPGKACQKMLPPIQFIVTYETFVSVEVACNRLMVREFGCSWLMTIPT